MVLIALTGETGAGKTLLIDAISLLMGGRAEPGLVRAGAEQASIDGRFIRDDEEYVLSRSCQPMVDLGPTSTADRRPSARWLSWERRWLIFMASTRISRC